MKVYIKVIKDIYATAFYIFIMSINEKTRLARVDRWQGMKAAWESKLDKAENQNDTDVANKMIAEADMMLSRLETKGEVVSEEEAYSKPSMGKITKKTKADRNKRNQDTQPNSKDDTGILGV